VVEEAATNGGILSVARDKQHLNLGPQLAGKFRKLATIHNREAHIGQQQIYSYGAPQALSVRAAAQVPIAPWVDKVCRISAVGI
jgi:hypothetical protein